MVSRIIKLVSSEPVNWFAVPPPLTRADLRFTATLRKKFLVFQDPYFCNHDENLLYVYDKYSLMWFAWIRVLLLVWLCVSSPLLLRPCFLCIMNYLLCMTHGLATAHLHDCAWTAIWAENICTSEHDNVPMELRCDGRQHGRRGGLYTTKVKWKIYQTSCTLLDVGFVFTLRRTDIFILIWACTAVLPNITTVIFQIIPALN